MFVILLEARQFHFLGRVLDYNCSLEIFETGCFMPNDVDENNVKLLQDRSFMLFFLKIVTHQRLCVDSIWYIEFKSIVGCRD